MLKFAVVVGQEGHTLSASTGGARLSLQTKFDAFRFQRTLTNLTVVCGRGGTEASAGHKTRTQWTAVGFDNKQQASLVVTMLFINTTASVEAELIHTQTAGTMPTHHTFRLRTRASSLHKERWHSGQARESVGLLEANKGRLQAGARCQGLSSAASEDTTSSTDRLDLGIF